ncbi:MAG: adenosine deaminase [Burkholderiaceae bacterium]
MNHPAAQAPSPLHDFLHAIPKVEIHCHLLGTVRHATFRELAARAAQRATDHQAPVPLTQDAVDAFYIRGDKPVGVLKALRALDAHLLATPDDLHRITYEYLEDAARHNVRHAEFFWNPTGTARDSGMAYPVALAAIVRAIEDARTDHGIHGWLIPAIAREASPQDAVTMVQWVIAHRCDAVLGIGIDYSEVNRPPEMFAQAYALARQGGLKTTAHAGEFGMPWANVRTAVELLQVDRIDHGYTIVDAPDFARQCADRGMVFTVVPTNSYYLRTLPKERWALDHPIRRMPALGLRIHPNTDDPTLHQVTPTQAWMMMVRDFGFTLDDLRGFMVNGLDGAWMESTTRRAWRADFDRAFDDLRRRYQLQTPISEQP